MITLNGQNFNCAVQARNRTGSLADFVSATVGGRSCIAYNGSTEGWIRIGFGEPAKQEGSISLSTDSILRPCVVDAALVLPTLATGSDGYTDLGCFFLSNDGNSGGLYLYLQSVVSGGAGSLRLRTTLAGTNYDVALGSVSAGETPFKRVVLHAYRDKIKVWLDGAAKSDLVVTGVSFDALFPHSIDLSWRSPLACKAAWDYILYGIERVDYSAALGASETNRHPDQGKLYFIKSTDLAAAISAGTSFERDIADGVFTAPTVDGTYLVAKVCTTGESAADVLTRAAGNWSGGSL